MELKNDPIEEYVYIGYLNEQMLPHGVGAYISPITMKAYLTANFNDGWIDGFGRKNAPDGTIIEGHYKRS